MRDSYRAPNQVVIHWLEGNRHIGTVNKVPNLLTQWLDIYCLITRLSRD